MKKFSINLLKVTLLLILGLCVFSVGNEVSAVDLEYNKKGEVLKLDSSKGIWEYKITDVNGNQIKNDDNHKITLSGISSLYWGSLYWPALLDGQGSTNPSRKYLSTTISFQSKVPGQYVLTYTEAIKKYTGNWDADKGETKTIPITVAKAATKTEYVTLTLNFNGGSDSDGNKSKSYERTKNEYISLSLDALNYKLKLGEITKEGYTFVGWGTTAKQKTPTYKNDPNSQIRITQNTTLYAIWEEEVVNPPAHKKEDEPAATVVAKDKSGTPIEVDQYLKYTDVTNEDGWNLRKAVNGGVKGIIEDGSILKVTKLGSNNRYVQVTVVEGKLKGQEGWINITTNGAKNFEILDSYTPAENPNTPATGEEEESDTPATGNLDLSGIVGATGGIMEVLLPMITSILSRLWEFINTTVLPNIGPAMNTGMQFITTVIGGLIKQ